MGYHDILVLTDNSDDSVALIHAGVEAAGRSGATLTGVFIRHPFMYPYIGAEFGSYLPRDVIQSLNDDHVAMVRAASTLAKDRFQDRTRAAGVTAEWLELDGTEAHDLVARARCADLLVYPKAGLPGPGFTAAEMTMAVGGPVMLVARSITPTRPIQRALLAWNGSREAANALRGAWPLLQGLTELTVLIVGTDHAQALRRHIQNHGLTPNIIVHPSGEADAETVLSGQIKAMEADLVIMGLYGRTRLQEFILGGVSRTMLRDSEPTLLLVSH
jgi:nucleotide-binding universal stress UspA family protein